MKSRRSVQPRVIGGVEIFKSIVVGSRYSVDYLSLGARGSAVYGGGLERWWTYVNSHSVYLVKSYIRGKDGYDVYQIKRKNNISEGFEKISSLEQTIVMLLEAK